MDKEIKKMKTIEDIGWGYLRATGSVHAYGMIVSAREKIKELEKGNENQFGG